MEPNDQMPTQQPAPQPVEPPVATPPPVYSAPQPITQPLQAVPVGQPVPQPAIQNEMAPMPVSSSMQPSAPVELPETQPIQWQSAEYISHDKSPLWFVGFWAFVLVLMAVAALIVKSWSFTILVPVMATALVIYSHRPPRTLNYVLSTKGLYINDVLHPMSEFRAFGIIQEDAVPALMLIPVKRFRPALSVYFLQENGEAIVDLLGSRIPMEDLRLDMFDRIIRKLRI